MTKHDEYTMLLMGTRDGLTDQAAALLAREKIVFQRVPIANYVEPRLEYRIGVQPGGTVIGLDEIKGVIAHLKEELARQAA